MNSGYDFGYFVKLLTNESLPTSEDAFFDILRVWFPTVYDTKFMARGTDITQSSLGEIAERLEVSGPATQRPKAILTYSRLYALTTHTKQAPIRT